MVFWIWWSEIQSGQSQVSKAIVIVWHCCCWWGCVVQSAEACVYKRRLVGSSDTPWLRRVLQWPCGSPRPHQILRLCILRQIGLWTVWAHSLFCQKSMTKQWLYCIGILNIDFVAWWIRINLGAPKGYTTIASTLILLHRDYYHLFCCIMNSDRSIWAPQKGTQR